MCDQHLHNLLSSYDTHGNVASAEAACGDDFFHFLVFRIKRLARFCLPSTLAATTVHLAPYPVDNQPLSQFL